MLAPLMVMMMSPAGNEDFKKGKSSIKRNLYCYFYSPVVRPALSATLSSCTLLTDVHVSTAELSFSCSP